MLKFLGKCLKWVTFPVWYPIWGFVKVLRFCVEAIIATINLWNPSSRLGYAIKQCLLAVIIFPVTPTVASAAAWHSAGQPTTMEGIINAMLTGFGLS